jgi:tRNA (adenine37-N6)-methyltransferase
VGTNRPTEQQVKPIGIIRTPFTQALGTPIQPVYSQSTGMVEIYPECVEGLKDLEGFERIWLIYWCDRSAPASLQVTPFLDSRERGVFATRAPARPNPIGISCVRLLGVSGSSLEIAEVDVLDGTPLLDIKPYVPAFDAFPASRSGWLEACAQREATDDGRFSLGDADSED